MDKEEIIENEEQLEEIEENSETESLKNKLHEAEKKSEEYYDQLLRIKAEFQNYRKRIEKEKNNMIQFAGEKIFRELILSIIDNLERTLESAIDSHNVKAIIEGMEMILSQLKKDLDRFHVKQIESLGKTFDPTEHEAVERVVDPEIPENTIIKEVQKGYIYHDKLLRPAKVCVSLEPRDTENNDVDEACGEE